MKIYSTPTVSNSFLEDSNVNHMNGFMLHPTSISLENSIEFIRKIIGSAWNFKWGLTLSNSILCWINNLMSFSLLARKSLLFYCKEKCSRITRKVRAAFKE